MPWGFWELPNSKQEKPSIGQILVIYVLIKSLRCGSSIYHFKIDSMYFCNNRDAVTNKKVHIFPILHIFP